MALDANREVRKSYDKANPAYVAMDVSAPFSQVTTDEGRAKNPSNLEIPEKTKPLFAAKPSLASPDDAVSYTDDSDWVKQSFLVSDIQLNDISSDAVNRYWSSARHKFTDTRMGGNIGVNSRPQFTRYSDIREKGRISSRHDVGIQNVGGNYGMGRYYSEAIDDNSQTIYLRFGMPQFNSLLDFFSKAFDPEMSSLTRTGRATSMWYKIGKAAGTVMGVIAFPVLSAIILTGRFVRMFFTRPTSKFYTLKPTMHLYWSTVNTLVNTIAINKGIMPRVFDDGMLKAATGGGNQRDQQIGTPYHFDTEMLANLHKMMPDMFDSNYGIDVFAFANRAQRISNALFNEDYDRLDKGTESDFTGYVAKSDQLKLEKPNGQHTVSNVINRYAQATTFVQWLQRTLSDTPYYTSDTKKDTRIEMNPKNDEKAKGSIEKFAEYFDAEFRQGAQFAVFKVDNTGSASEAFSNSTVESDLSKKYNDTVSQAREAKFSLANGNITGTAVEDFVKGALGAAGDVVKGALDGVTMNVFSGLAGLTGTGFIDIPKHWQSSNAQLTRNSYNMQLVSPYGNPISQMQNLYIPLAMLMAGALPLSTGSQSYGSPFICQLFDRGKCQIQLGMIESLSITRGTANLPFNNRGQAMAIDVTLSVIDLSSIVHMPVSTGSLFETNITMDEDNILMDYLAVLAGQDIYSQIYALPKAKLNFAKRISSLNKLTSPAYWASFVHEQTTTGMLGLVGNSLEAVVAGSSVAAGQQQY